MDKHLSAKEIENKILENYLEYFVLFGAFQSEFLTGLYKRYKSLENGSLVLYFAKKTHQTILRKKDYDINFDLSLNNFWKNHKESKIQPTTILAISKDTFLPKETVRRKILKLVKNKILIRTSKIIGWFPDEEYQKDYNQFIEKEILQVVKITHFICEKFNYSISNKELEAEIKKRFSFYWFHYLNAQLKYIDLWRKQFKDVEIILIALQVLLLASKNTKKKISHSHLFNNPKIINNKISSKISVSATSVCDVTGIPRATCIRKLNLMVKLKIINQDNLTRRYYITPDAFSLKLVSSQTTKNVVKVFSEFFSICIKTINFKSAS